MKRVAAHALYIPDVGYLRRMVVELDQGIALRVYPLQGEMEDTLWLPGLLVLPSHPDEPFHYAAPEPFPTSANGALYSKELMQRAIGRRVAYCASFDFSRWRPADETLHIQWL